MIGMPQRRLVRRSALVAAVAVVAVATWIDAAAAIRGPFSLTASAGGLSTEARLVSYCPHGPSGAPCVSSRLDLTPDVRLPISPGQRLRLAVPQGDPAVRRVVVALGRPGRARSTSAVTIWTKQAMSSGEDDRLWLVTLPRELRGATFASIQIAYTGSRPPAVNGSARFLLGVRRACSPDT